MQIANMLHEESNGLILEDDLIPISDYLELSTTTVDREQVEKCAEYLGDYFRDVYVHPKHVFFPYYYQNGDVFLELIGGLNVDALQMVDMKERIKQHSALMKEREKSNKWSSYFGFVDKRIILPTFIKRFYEIPDNQKYDVFLKVYTRAEYGFQLFTPEFMESIFSYRTLSEEYHEDMSRLFETNQDEKLIIYRGVNKKSTSPELAYSWTLRKEVADFFAYRFEAGGQVYSAIVERSDILAYFPSRGEEEVLVRYVDLKDVERIV